jgi:hypothetical protein
MDRIATGLIIALAALLMTGGLSREVLAREPAAARPVPVVATASGLPQTAASRVLSLLLTLDALRTAPELIETPKVQPIGL